MAKIDYKKSETKSETKPQTKITPELSPPSFPPKIGLGLYDRGGRGPEKHFSSVDVYLLEEHEEKNTRVHVRPSAIEKKVFNTVLTTTLKQRTYDFQLTIELLNDAVKKSLGRLIQRTTQTQAGSIIITEYHIVGFRYDEVCKRIERLYRYP